MSRFRFACLATAAALSLIAGVANAADKVTFLTSWYAQAEHGGFYQAKAAGIYEKAGLDVTIKMGGPQVNGMQLLENLRAQLANYGGSVMQGEITPKSKILVMSTGRTHDVDKVGVFTPKRKELPALKAGEVGWITASIKDVHGAPVGDTLTLANDPAPKPLPGFQEMQPRVFAGLFPVDAEDYPDLREALDKLRLNDAALRFEPESSEAMGFGFRCGFLGMLHMEIVQERLEREYDLDLITTAPTVVYELLLNLLVMKYH